MTEADVSRWDWIAALFVVSVALILVSLVIAGAWMMVTQ